MKVLCVIDMQNDFISGTLGTKEAEAIVANVKRKLASYQAPRCRVFFTRDTHHKDYLATAEGKKLPVAHCIEGTEGHKLTEALDIGRAKVIDKPTFGSIALTDAIAKLKHVESIELVGLCTDICVISNALMLKARFYETPIIVDASCCAGVTPESHKNALSAMKMCQIDVINE